MSVTESPEHASHLPGGGVDAVGEIESHGIDYIPLGDRHSRPSVLAWVIAGEAFFFGVIVLGWLPIAFGLGWWSSFSAIVVGTTVGSLVVCPISLLGPRTGTNGPVSSGAYFGVVGRLIGTLISIFIAVGFAAIAVWTSGQAVLEGMHRLTGLSTGEGAYAITYAIIAVICLFVAIYGHANVVAVQKFLIPSVGLMMAIGAIVFADDANTSYHGGQYLLGGFWQTWILATVTALSLPISLAPYINDYARYIPPTTSSRRLLGFTFLGGMGVGLPLLFAAWTAIGFKDPLTEYIPGLVASSPEWFVVPIIIIGLLGGCGQAAFCLYGVGLDTSSLIPRLKRVPATVFLGTLAVGFVFLGDLVLGATNTVSSFVLLFIAVLMPWTVIVIIGHFWRRGYYKPDDLQVFNRGERGGVYWFTRGVNLRALAAYIPAATAGLLFLNTSLYTGPWANLADGVDLSFIGSGVIAAVLYVVALVVFPEPDAVRRDVRDDPGASDDPVARPDAV